MMALSVIVQLVGFVCMIIILVHAFKHGGVLQGLLCLCVPLYLLYYAFARFEHEKKNLILGVLFGSMAIALVLEYLAAPAR